MKTRRGQRSLRFDAPLSIREYAELLYAALRCLRRSDRTLATFSDNGSVEIVTVQFIRERTGR